VVEFLWNRAEDRYAFGGRLANHKVSRFAKINTKQRKRAAGTMSGRP
jgi:hypothetical protein